MRGIGELRSHFDARHFVEVGIGCEACHGGSREHVANPRVHPSFAPRSPFLEVRREAGGDITRAEEVNRVCARCHQVLFSRYLFTWEGGTRRPGNADAAGGSSITSGEARDFLLGGCAQRMSCATCHDPHAEDKRADLERLTSVAGNAVCVRCHAQYAPAPALAAHAHHDPGGAGASCVGCHMPKKNMGLGYALTRYHRIGRPNDPVRVERDRPIECALCHADKTVADLVTTMEGWWGKRYDRAALADLYGTLDARPLVATLTRGKAHEQAVAVAVLGEARRTEATAGRRAPAREPVPARALLRAARARVAAAAPVPRRSRSADAGDHRGRARLRAGGVPRGDRAAGRRRQRPSQRRHRRGVTTLAPPSSGSQTVSSYSQAPQPSPMLTPAPIRTPPGAVASHPLSGTAVIGASAITRPWSRSFTRPPFTSPKRDCRAARRAGRPAALHRRPTRARPT